MLSDDVLLSKIPRVQFVPDLMTIFDCICIYHLSKDSVRKTKSSENGKESIWILRMKLTMKKGNCRFDNFHCVLDSDFFIFDITCKCENNFKNVEQWHRMHDLSVQCEKSITVVFYTLECDAAWKSDTSFQQNITLAMMIWSFIDFSDQTRNIFFSTLSTKKHKFTTILIDHVQHGNDIQLQIWRSRFDVWRVVLPQCIRKQCIIESTFVTSLCPYVFSNSITITCSSITLIILIVCHSTVTMLMKLWSRSILSVFCRTIIVHLEDSSSLFGFSNQFRMNTKMKDQTTIDHQ